MKLIYKHFNCPICEFDKNKKVYDSNLGENELPVIGYDFKNPNQKKTFSYVSCLNCSHVFASPRITDMYKYYVDKEDEHYVSNSKFRRLTYKNVIDVIKNFKQTGEILELGSGMGDFIHSATESGFKCTGIEIDKHASNLSIKLGHNIFQSELKDFIKSNKVEFDIIVMMGVIEHLEYPSDTLDELNSILKKNGIIVLWTGDYDSVYSKLLKKKWWYVIGQHIQLFSRKSLKYLFKKKSYKLIYDGNFPYVFHHEYLDFHLNRFFLYRRCLKYMFFPILKYLNSIKLSLSSEILMIFRKD